MLKYGHPENSCHLYVLISIRFLNINWVKMSISPYFRSPFTDLTGGMISHQMLGRCQKQEIHYMDCLEAYGLERGKIKCHHLLSDYQECQTLTLQYKRFIAMRKERERQIAEGKLKGDGKYVTPQIDSY